MTREGRPGIGTRTAQNLYAANVSTNSSIPQSGTPRKVYVRAVATVHLDRLTSAHDIGAELWYRTVMLKPGTTVRLEVGTAWPPVYLPDVRADLVYAVDTWRGDLADAWIDSLDRAGARAVLA